MHEQEKFFFERKYLNNLYSLQVSKKGPLVVNSSVERAAVLPKSEEQKIQQHFQAVGLVF